MAIPGGYRFAAPFDEVFPEGAYVLGVEQAFDWDRNGNKTPAKDNVTGQLVWNVQVTEVFEGLTATTYEQNGGGAVQPAREGDAGSPCGEREPWGRQVRAVRAGSGVGRGECA
ncbi:hypothetical protein [Amycolatopsis palatopharyngis]|uniref:hypothetical protein n=1 Tax=Amycolatopsis palatopharyngis TaxID=187982 RepID=UPI000E225F45|nr:hypothetical protein [Amycolatopsis palatopharyngis]